MSFLLASNVLVLILFIVYLNRNKLWLEFLFCLLNPKSYRRREFLLSPWGYYADDESILRVDITEWYLKSYLNGLKSDIKGSLKLHKKGMKGRMLKTNSQIRQLKCRVKIDEMLDIKRAGFTILKQMKSKNCLKILVEKDGAKFIIRKEKMLFLCVYRDMVVPQVNLDKGRIIVKSEGLSKTIKDSISRQDEMLFLEPQVYPWMSFKQNLFYTPFFGGYFDFEEGFNFMDVFPLLAQVVGLDPLTITLNVYFSICWLLKTMEINFDLIRLMRLGLVEFKRYVFIGKLDGKLEMFPSFLSQERLGFDSPCDRMSGKYYLQESPILYMMGVIPEGVEVVLEDIESKGCREEIGLLMYISLLNLYRRKSELRRIFLNDFNSSKVEKLVLETPLMFNLSGGAFSVGFNDNFNYDSHYNIKKMQIDVEQNIARKYFNIWRGKIKTKKSHSLVTVHECPPGDKVFQEIRYNVKLNKSHERFDEIHYYLTNRIRGDSISSGYGDQVFVIEATELLEITGLIYLLQRGEKVFIDPKVGRDSLHIRNGHCPDNNHIDFGGRMLFKKRGRVLVGDKSVDPEWIGFCEKSRLFDYATCRTIYSYLLSKSIPIEHFGLVCSFIKGKNTRVNSGEIGNSVWKGITSDISNYIRKKTDGKVRFYNVTQRSFKDGSTLSEIEKNLNLEEKSLPSIYIPIERAAVEKKVKSGGKAEEKERIKIEKKKEMEFIKAKMGKGLTGLDAKKEYEKMKAVEKDEVCPTKEADQGFHLDYTKIINIMKESSVCLNNVQEEVKEGEVKVKTKRNMHSLIKKMQEETLSASIEEERKERIKKKMKTFSDLDQDPSKSDDFFSENMKLLFSEKKGRLYGEVTSRIESLIARAASNVTKVLRDPEWKGECVFKESNDICESYKAVLGLINIRTPWKIQEAGERIKNIPTANKESLRKIAQYIFETVYEFKDSSYENQMKKRVEDVKCESSIEILNLLIKKIKGEEIESLKKELRNIKSPKILSTNPFSVLMNAKEDEIEKSTVLALRSVLHNKVEKIGEKIMLKVDKVKRFKGNKGRGAEGSLKNLNRFSITKGVGGVLKDIKGVKNIVELKIKIEDINNFREKIAELNESIMETSQLTKRPEEGRLKSIKTVKIDRISNQKHQEVYAVMNKLIFSLLKNKGISKKIMYLTTYQVLNSLF